MRWSYAILSIVGGGALLGLLMGAASDPTMKRAPDPPWRLAARAIAAAPPDYDLVDTRPEDLSPAYWSAGSGPFALRDRVPHPASWRLADYAPPPEPALEETPLEATEPPLPADGIQATAHDVEAEIEAVAEAVRDARAALRRADTPGGAVGEAAAAL